ncbi:MAG: ATPase, T2SS/T4P/T4SS family, partial [Patescibacteria group bacterium]
MPDQISSPVSPPTDDHPQLQISSAEVAEQLADKKTELDLAAKERVIATRAAGLGQSYIDLTTVAISPEAIGTIPEETARAAKMICFDRNGDNLKVGAVAPAAPAARQELERLAAAGYHVTTYVISDHSFDQAVFFYKTVPKVRKVQLEVTIASADLAKFKDQFTNFEDLAKKIRTISTTELVVLLVAAALDARASDIHIEAEEAGIMVRFRVDGILHEIVDLPKDAWHKLSSRIKLLARLKLNVADKPQDGGFTIDRPNDKIDVRVSTIPTNYGESIVLRLLMSSSTAIEFDDLGLRGKADSDLKREMIKPNGMIITTGPTGSGKTTTLYAMLHQLNKPEVKIITLEDPIEYKLEGINQSQIKT